MLTDVLDLLKQFAIIGGMVMIVWGAIITGSAMREQEGPQITKGVWTIVGGALICAAGVLFSTVV
ncbi:hypothetical protein E5991_07930 [Bifidobacterium pseudolongum]|uniref:Uncharacterized protein n=2 Tax=Bifidobacterium pseudolongum TaxID=1694 RepID=A0A4S4F4I4_9BIFI|nr:hypothetical protein E5991_07930 [Bifidobacterium pseudolongum]